MKTLRYLIQFLIPVLLIASCTEVEKEAIPIQDLTSEEIELYQKIMAYRKQNDLPAIPLSQSLTYVAKTHLRDLIENRPNNGNCNLHSWSSKGNWTPCCYTSDHAKAECMWKKPGELTSYTDNGYEISFRSTGLVTAQVVLDFWIKSPGHNAVIMNEGIWSQEWSAIGIAIDGEYANVWFGNTKEEKR
jgi:uncharacterized protein YkwD